ncbi:MAG: flagellar hook assembly protein FlgD [Armatimonadota bacterium]|nr:flagellar hook assembly protein FlgD [Armatimonadota bacterium]MDR7429737.1 flagellar hook assembly protein FlgD [Armatimonadota bacterium]MDR7447144.1 flagellar hook assembly protein FlgD [Armatimonadota bacterium]MDR7477664.1 flagellar hook assembly protein FlgD [Armatimonadota bacterium]MDR7514271.1 flagellar hook assembly protein FlgD [Armatimonadota bacterium]
MAVQVQQVQAGGQAAAGPRVLGKDDFLKLLVAQLRHQDPLQPVSDREFVAQLAQFSALEQMTNVSQAVLELARRQEAAAAFGLVGRRVKVQAEDGSTVEGTVSSVRRRDGTFVLVVGDRAYTLDQLVEVVA